MRLPDLTEPVVMEAIHEFYDHVSGYVDAVSRMVSNNPTRLRKTPRRMGLRSMPFFYAVELHQLFDFACGRKEMSATWVEEQCSQLMELLTRSMSGYYAQLDPTFAQKPLGMAIMACGARLSLRQEEGQIPLREVLLLSACSPQELEETGLQPSGQGESGESTFDVQDVRAKFEELGIPV